LKKYLVKLAPDERAKLESLIRGGRASVRRVKRALVLLAVDDGDKDEVVAGKARVSAGTVGRIRQRFVEEGLEAALSERSRPGKAPLLDGPQEAHLLGRLAPCNANFVHAALSPSVWQRLSKSVSS